MKKFIFLAALVAWSVNGQIINDVVAYDGVVLVAGAAPPAPVIYNEPVVYNAPVNYEGPVIYNAPVVYNNGGFVNVNAPDYQQPCNYLGYPDAYSCPPSGYSPSVIYVGGSQGSYGGYNYSGYGSCSPNVIYIGAGDPFRRSHSLHHGLH